MLVSSLRQGLFVPPVTDLTPQARQTLEIQGHTPRHARKLVLEDRHINWSTWTSGEILRRAEILGPLWSSLTVPVFDAMGKHSWGTHKIVWSGGFEVLNPHASTYGSDVGADPGMEGMQPHLPPGHGYVSWDKEALMVNTVDGMVARAREMTVAGGRKGSVRGLGAKYELFDPADLQGRGGVLFYPAWNAFT